MYINTPLARPRAPFATDDRSLSEMPVASPGASRSLLSKMTLPWSLLLLGSGYFLLVAGPLLTSRFSALRWLRDVATGNAWLPAPAAAGTALLGAAALIFVVARLVRDVEQRPYASIAPVLAVFSGFVLTSLRTELPLPGMAAPQLGVLVLALALLGGALIGRHGVGERALGWSLTVLPSLVLLFALTAVFGDPASMLRGVGSSSRTFLLLLAVSSLSLGLVGAVARHLLSRASGPSAAAVRALQGPTGVFSEANLRQDQQGFGLPGFGAQAFPEPDLRLPRVPTRPTPQPMSVPPAQTRISTQGGFRSAAPQYAAAPAQQVVRTLPMQRVGPTHAPTHFDPAAQRPPMSAPPQQLARVSYGHQTPVVTELAMDDPDLILLTGRKAPLGRILSAVVLLAVSGAVGTYMFVLRPREQASEQARAHAAAHKKAVVPAVPSVDEAELDREAEASAAKLRAVLERSGTATSKPSEAATAGSAPVVTPLVTPMGTSLVPTQPSAQAPVPATVTPSEAAPVVREHHHRSRRHHGVDKASRSAAPALDDSAQDAADESERPAPAKLEAPAKPTSKAPAKAEPASEDLDLDQLVHKALKKESGGVDAQEDPILGL